MELKELKAKALPRGYKILPDGRVFSTDSNWRGIRERLMIQDSNNFGYKRVRLTVGGRRKVYFVHKLVANIFIGPKPTPQHEVCHIDGNKENNHVSNLRWGTRKENAADRTKHGHCRAAENGKKSALKTSETMKLMWRNQYAEGPGHAKKIS